MAETVVFAPGGYRYIEAVFQYSGGVAAEAHLEVLGRPTSAFAACELRSPALHAFSYTVVALGVSWADAVSTQAYTVRDIGALIGPEVLAHGAGNGGLEWHFCRPPVVGLEFEMDVRGAAREVVL